MNIFAALFGKRPQAGTELAEVIRHDPSDISRKAVEVLRKTPNTDPYRPYTTEFDREITGDQLNSVLGHLTPAHQQALKDAWDSFQNGLAGWRTRIHVSALDASAQIRLALTEAQLRDCTFTFLVDQSGSMRGQSMLLAAAAIDVAQDFLSHLGCSVEILGFTTSSWMGGKSRQKWLNKNRAPHPGRLCDLLHIVYQPASVGIAGTGAWTLRPMLRPDLPKENVDGEALEWAASRLHNQPHAYRFLIVVSDGAPVDDSTLMENGAAYMEKHLRAVIKHLEDEAALYLAAVGIGHDVTRYYQNGVTVQTPEDMGEAVINQIRGLLLPLSETDSAPNLV